MQLDIEVSEREALVTAEVEMKVLSPSTACSPIAANCTGTCWDPAAGIARPMPGSRQTCRSRSGYESRKPSPGPDPGLYRRAAKEARHVPLGQGAAATWPKEPYVQARVDGHPGAALRDLEAPRDALSIQGIQPEGKDG
jgi:hypothetical protein